MGSNQTLEDFIDINPPRILKKGGLSKYVAMADVQPWVRDIQNFITREYKGSGSRFQNGDTILARITPCLENGKTALINCLDDNEIAHGSTEFIVLSGKKGKSDNRFVYYLTRDPMFREFAIQSMEGTSGRQRVPVPAIANMGIDLPSLEDQKKIAKFLGSLDDKIELNRRMNETLEAVARAIFKSWFVDFDPVRVRRGGEGRDTGLPQEISDLFPDSFVDSELGKIPKGWTATTLGNVIEIFDSKRIPLSGRERAKRQGIYPYHGATSIMGYIDDYLFDGLYILLAEDGSVKNDDGTPVVQYVWGKFWVNNHAHILKGKTPISDEHLMLYIKQIDVNPFITGAVQLKLNQGNMNRIPFILPTSDICVAFDEQISPLFEQIRILSDEIINLAKIRDELLPKLISGEFLK